MILIKWSSSEGDIVVIHEETFLAEQIDNACAFFDWVCQLPNAFDRYFYVAEQHV